MYCRTCGHENPEHSMFCGGCGASQSASPTSDIGVAPSALPTTGERRLLGDDEQFCYSCGEIVKKAAAICLKCGVIPRDAFGGKSANPSSKLLLAIPVGSLILGIVGVLTLLDPGWDMETAFGVLILFGIPPIVLGVISIRQHFEGKLMGIIGLILGCVTSMAMFGIMVTM